MNVRQHIQVRSVMLSNIHMSLALLVYISYARQKFQTHIFRSIRGSNFYRSVSVLNVPKYLKLLGLYLYTLIIGHKSSNMLSVLNKLTLQKEMQNFVTKNVFLDKKRKINHNKTNKSNIKTLAGARK